MTRRLPAMQAVAAEIAVRVEGRNQETWLVDWRFLTEDACIKLK
ncbi:MAG: hypothetical protein ABW185_29100 [Sedimenticola sp.]